MKYMCEHCEDMYTTEDEAKACELKCTIAQDYIPTINKLTEQLDTVMRLLRYCYPLIPEDYDSLRKDMAKYIPLIHRVNITTNERVPIDRVYVIPDMSNIIG